MRDIQVGDVKPYYRHVCGGDLLYVRDVSVGLVDIREFKCVNCGKLVDDANYSVLVEYDPFRNDATHIFNMMLEHWHKGSWKSEWVQHSVEEFVKKYCPEIANRIWGYSK